MQDPGKYGSRRHTPKSCYEAGREDSEREDKKSSGAGSMRK